ncbi:beta-trefoil DNA-binding domain-containing protein [Chlamydoabsidia padenii]|nr:beta-trefoil DNA-binding domain-containing protein [Chlamydoabsidia padenii]
MSPPPSQQEEPKRLVTVTCLHAAVAQKSYGSEKRFLCPPPAIAIQQHHQEATCPVVTMSVFAEGAERPIEQRTCLDENNCGSFKYLHVTGSAKTKQFCLKVNMSHSAPLTSCITPAFATFFSSPISIISKPSKKTAKARNVSSCIFTTSQISLFNRINSQSVRTKYLTSAPSDQQQQELCAKNSTWSAFDIILVRQPTPPPQHTLSHNHHHYHHHHQPSVTTAGVPLTYGTEIILKDSQSGVCSPPVIIRKVDKGAISPDAFGPVSQMQKIALQLASSSDRPVYLSANGNAIQEINTKPSSQDDNSSGNGINHTHASTWLDYCVSKQVLDQTGASIEKVDDYLCWTIVGIAKFEYTVEEPPKSTATTTPIISTTLQQPSPVSHSDSLNSNKYRPEIMPRLLQPSPPPSPPRTIVPFPMVSDVMVDDAKHALQLTGQHLVQHLPTAPYPHLLEFWLGGAHGPLPVLQRQLAAQGNIQLSLTLPPTQDFLVAHHDLLVKTDDGNRAIELPLLMVRKDNVVYHSGKSVTCHVKPNGDTHWSIMDVPK